jgi:ABC-type multidrug transport system permease subunit
VVINYFFRAISGEGNWLKTYRFYFLVAARKWGKFCANIFPYFESAIPVSAFLPLVYAQDALTGR